MTAVVRAARFLQNRGVKTLFLEARHRAYARYYDRSLGIDTIALIEPEKMDYSNTDAACYYPCGYQSIFWALRQLPFRETEVELVDFGCGLGRVVATAATKAYRRVTGVELSKDLSDRGRANLARLRGCRAQRVDIWQGDATQFVIPETSNVFFLFNPFSGETLERVTANIRESLDRHPRPAIIIFFNEDHFERQTAGQSWFRRTHRDKFYPNYTGAIYRAG